MSVPPSYLAQPLAMPYPPPSQLGSGYGPEYQHPGYPPQDLASSGYAPEYQQPGYPPQDFPEQHPLNSPHQATPHSQAFVGDGQNYATNANFASDAFNDKTIRRNFIAKVYAILTVQLAITMVFILVFALVQPVKNWVRTNQWFYWIAYGVFFCTYIALVCCSSVRRKYPGNFIALGIFTFAFSYLAGTITSFHGINSVIICVGVTTAICLIVSLAAIMCPFDLTKCSMLIFIISIGFMLFGVACGIAFAIGGRNSVLQAVYGGIAALVFSLYLAYDTQMVIGGRKYDISPEEYIYASLQLYVDVVNIFLAMLTLFGSSD